MSGNLSLPQDKSFLLYCRELGETPLLSREEEISLCQDINSLDEDLSKKAFSKLVSANLRLVVKIAKQYGNFGLEMGDLISEGNIGLAHAAKKFDLEKKVRFSTYASFWIKQAIRKALSNKSRLVRLPTHLTQLNHSIINYCNQYEITHGEEPTENQIASALDVSVGKIKKLREANSINNFIFLNEKSNDENDEEKFAFLKDSNTQPPDQILSFSDDVKILKNQLNLTLSDREKRVIKYRFGLDNSERKTLEQLGDEFGITKERIRQIEQTALRKLESSLRKKMN